MERSGKIPDVLAVHGHGYGSNEIVGLLPDGSLDPEKPGIHGHFAVELVKRWLMVVAPDVIGFGERRLGEDLDKDPRVSSSCYKLATQLLLYGKTLTGLRVTEFLAALDYLAGSEETDSTGSAQWASPTEPYVLTGFPGTFKGTIMEVFHCVDNFTPVKLKHAELPEWIGLIAPRALFVESAIYQQKNG